MDALFLLFVSIFLSSIGQLTLKFGLNRIGELTLLRSNLGTLFLKILSSPVLLLGLFFYGVSAFIWIIGLSKVPLSKAYPLISVSYIIVVFFSWFLLHENISPLKIVALVVICFGVFLLSRAV